MTPSHPKIAIFVLPPPHGSKCDSVLVRAGISSTTCRTTLRRSAWSAPAVGVECNSSASGDAVDAECTFAGFVGKVTYVPKDPADYEFVVQ